MAEKTEVLIVKNPFVYKNLAPEAYDYFMAQGGRWIPIVFGVIEKVVNNHFMALCELDWDYIKEADDATQKTHALYKTVYYMGLNEEQEKFVRSVADEIENELVLTAQEALDSAKAQAEDAE